MALAHIDLHSHSTCSDGQYPVPEVARRAAAGGLKVWSLSDHDTVAGLAEADVEARSLGMRLVPGIEVSATHDRREVHILGHFIDPVSAGLMTLGDDMAVERRARMVEMIAKLRPLGMAVTIAEVEKFSGGKTLGRPHLARALVERGLVSDVKEAFDRFLGAGRPAYVDRGRPSAEDAIALIRSAGGTATIAHPGVSQVERGDLMRLKASGLSGVESLHYDHNPSIRDKYLGLCAELDLVPTAGSDFHGEAVAPNRVFGSVTMSVEQLAALEARRP